MLNSKNANLTLAWTLANSNIIDSLVDVTNTSSQIQLSEAP